MFTLLTICFFAGGCVGDDGREVIGSYAPAPDATEESGAGGEDAGTDTVSGEIDEDVEFDTTSNLDTGSDSE